MNILQNKLNQNWRNYDSGVEIQNPIEKKLSAKGRKRIGVIPNNINSGRQMTFLTNKRESNYSYFSTPISSRLVANFGFDDVARKDIEKYKKKLENPNISDRQRADAQKQIDYLQGRLDARNPKTTNSNNPNETVSKPTTSTSGGDTNSQSLIESRNNSASDEFNRQFGNSESNRAKTNRGRKKPNDFAFSKSDANEAINTLRQSEFDKFVQNTNNKAAKANTPNDFVSKVNKVDDKVARKIPTKTLGAVAGVAGAGLTLNEVRKRMKKDKEAKYSFMDNIVEI